MKWSYQWVGCLVLQNGETTSLERPVLQQWVRPWSQRHLGPTHVQHLWRTSPPQHHVSLAQHTATLENNNRACFWWRRLCVFFQSLGDRGEKIPRTLCWVQKQRCVLWSIFCSPVPLDTLSTVQFTTAEDCTGLTHDHIHVKWQRDGWGAAVSREKGLRLGGETGTERREERDCVFVCWEWGLNTQLPQSHCGS